MRTEYLKYFSASITMFAAIITFFLFAEKTGFFFLSEKWTILIGVVASAYAAFFSIFLSRRLKRKRERERIFLIYSHKDKEAVRNISNKLKEMGYNPWLDEEEIVPGQNWQNTVLQGIENSALALYLSSKNTESSKGFMNSELKAARNLLRSSKESQSPIIPVFIEDSELPDELVGIHAVKLYEEKGYEQLDKGLKFFLGKHLTNA